MPPKRSLLDVRMGQIKEIDGYLQDETIHQQASRELELMAEAGRVFDPLGMKLRLNLIAAASALVDKADEMLKPWGLTGSTFNVLMTVRQSEGRELKMSEVANLIVTRPRNVTPLVDLLVAADYLERRPSEEDRRVVYVSLTEQGSARLDSLLPHLFGKFADAVSEIDEDEMVCCIAATAKLRQKLATLEVDDRVDGAEATDGKEGLDG